MIDRKNNFNLSVNNQQRTYENIKIKLTGQGDDYTTICLLDYNY